MPILVNLVPRNFYIYRHIRLDTGRPFYVGKGCGRRAKQRVGRNEYWHRIVKKHGYKVELIEENLSEDEALQREQTFIKLYKAHGMCEANLTLGGEGTSGLLKSKETKLKIAKSHGAKPFEVYDCNGSVVGVWEGITDCANELGLTHESVFRALKRDKFPAYKVRGYYFKYLDRSYTFEQMRQVPKREPKPMPEKCTFLGRKHSEETKAKLAELARKQCSGSGNPRYKGTVVTPLGTFKDAHEAAEKLGLPYSTIRGRLQRKSCPDWYYEKDRNGG